MSSKRMIQQWVIEEARERVSMKDILTRFGYRPRRYVGQHKDALYLCPFHRERTPSFYVVQRKGFCCCIGCGFSGDIIALVAQLNGWGFRRSVIYLATKVLGKTYKEIFSEQRCFAEIPSVEKQGEERPIPLLSGDDDDGIPF